MNSDEHMVIGGLLGFGGYLFYCFVKQRPADIFEAFLSLVGGAFVGLLPDIIEPATNPNHRGIFHSIGLFSLLIYGEYKVLQSESLTEDQKAAISTLIAAYGSHLVADGTTRKGLPII